MNRLVYVAHRYADDPAGNVAKMRAICRAIVDAGDIPICAPLYLPAFLDESTERALALEIGLRLIDLCREVRVFGSISAGVQAEIDHAIAARIPVVFVGTDGGA